MASYRRKFPTLAVTLALALVAVPGAAQSTGSATGKPALVDAAGARQLYKSGETKFKAQDYTGALADFQAVDAVKSTSQSARYIGLCQDKLGHYEEAVQAYERFLADAPVKLEKESDEIKTRVGEIRAMPGHVHIETTPAGATLTIDGKPAAGVSPLDVDLPPGAHSISATAEGRGAADRTVTVAFASKQDVTVELPLVVPPPVVAAVPVPAPPPPPPPPAPPPPEVRSKLPAIITGGLAVVAAGIGTAFGIVTLSDKSNFNKTPTESIAETGQNHALIADMSFGVAITLGVTSVVLLLTKDDTDASKVKAVLLPTVRLSKREGTTLSASPVLTPHGGGVGALVSF
jgi:hypothetical protein